MRMMPRAPSAMRCSFESLVRAFCCRTFSSSLLALLLRWTDNFSINKDPPELIGASLSEPHINVLNVSSVCMYVCMCICIRTSYRKFRIR